MCKADRSVLVVVFHKMTGRIIWPCVESKKSCILLMSNNMRGEVIYPALVRLVFGETGLFWSWEYNPQGSPPPIAR